MTPTPLVNNIFPNGVREGFKPSAHQTGKVKLYLPVASTSALSLTYTSEVPKFQRSKTALLQTHFQNVVLPPNSHSDILRTSVRREFACAKLQIIFNIPKNSVIFLEEIDDDDTDDADDTWQFFVIDR